MSGKNPPIMKTTRRSARRRGQEHDPVIAPGFGTKKDIAKLSQDLSSGDSNLPPEAVEAMMNSMGKGIMSPTAKDPNAASTKPGATSSAWADFMKEEGVDVFGNNSATSSGAAATASTKTAKAAEEASKKKSSSPRKKANKRKAYNLESLEIDDKKKRPKVNAGGSLVQTGTMDVTVVGRKGLSKEAPRYQLVIPTRIFPGTAITKVFSSSTSCHSIALDASGQVYGWGRNDQGQLSSSLPKNVAAPTLLEGLSDYTIVSAALGKGHTLVLTDEGTVLATGFNKMGQCGVKSSIETISQFKPCVLPPDVKISQIACGENFSVALSEKGQIYTTGSSEHGVLGNGETGEYFVTASKIAFANCNVFTLRNQFVEKDPTQETFGSSKDKMTPIPEDIRIQHIACGKNHTVAVEAACDKDDDEEEIKPRVFSWGCGDYGVLGHGVQADEYFPREIAALGTTIWLPPGDLTVSAGAHCSLLKTSNGHVYYWGKHRSVGEAQLRPQLVEVLANNRHVVSHCNAGGQTVVCCTEGAQTVAWGQGPHGELGLGTAKSSAKPQFVDALTGARIQDLACGYGHTLFVVKDEDAEDKKAIEKLDLLEDTAIEELKAVWAAAPAGGEKKGKKRSK